MGTDRKSGWGRRAALIGGGVVVVIALVGGAFVVGQAYGQHQAATSARPPALTLQLPAIGDCEAGSWVLDAGNTSRRGTRLLTLLPAVPGDPGGTPVYASHDFDSNGKPEYVRKLVCKTTDRDPTEAVVAMTDTAPNTAVALGNTPVCSSLVEPSDTAGLTNYRITTASLDGIHSQFIVAVDGPSAGTFSWSASSHSWVTFGA
jgi:hypothetical protein